MIIIYATDWCPDCLRARTVFQKLKVPFRWVNIDQDQEARARVMEINRGNRSVPTILFEDGTILVEPSTKALEEKLRASLP